MPQYQKPTQKFSPSIVHIGKSKSHVGFKIIGGDCDIWIKLCAASEATCTRKRSWKITETVKTFYLNFPGL